MGCDASSRPALRDEDEANRAYRRSLVGRQTLPPRDHPPMTPATDTQIDLFTWARDLERENERITKANEERARRRGYLVFATDPAVSPDDPGYREVYATEARTP